MRDYWWYDSEDGKDIWKKVNFAAKASTMFALPLWVFDISMVEVPKRPIHIPLRALTIMTPIVGGATLFAFTSQILCREVPKMDPKFSYFCGGAAAGTIIGAVKKSPAVGCVAALYVGLFATIIRYAHEENWRVPWDDIKPMARSDSAWEEMDFSLTKRKHLDPPSSGPGWTL